MGEGANRGTGLLELDEESRNDGKPTLLLAILSVCFVFMVSLMPDFECRTNPNYGGPLQRERSSARICSGPILLLLYSPVIVSSIRLGN